MSLLLKYQIYILILFALPVFAREPIDANRYGSLSGIQAADQVIQIKVSGTSSPKYHYNKEPSKFLVANHLTISPNSRVLDLTMKEGHNSIFLAIKGHRVVGVEPDQSLFNRAKRQIRDFGVRVDMIQANYSSIFQNPDKYDVVLISNIVDRKLYRNAVQKVKKGGLLIIEGQTYANSYRSKTKLAFNELLKLFDKSRILAFRAPSSLNSGLSSIIIRKQYK